jgi:branched-chain amino acid aminotransferase
MSKVCYLNGEYIAEEKATVPISDLGLTRGYGIFDFFRTYNGKPFMMEKHLKRFRNSAFKLRIALKETDDDLVAIVAKLMQENQLKDAGVRLVITGGQSTDGFSPGIPNFFIAVATLPSYDSACWTEGIAIMTHDFQRVFPEIKSNNYLTAIALQEERADQNAFDILYTHEGKVLEMTRGNFFLFKGSTLYTAAENVLKGCTRGLALELAEGHFELKIADVWIDDLEECDEAFMTGTTKKIMPVTTIDGKPVGNGQVGENTKHLMSLFEAHVKAN